MSATYACALSRSRRQSGSCCRLLLHRIRKIMQPAIHNTTFQPKSQDGMPKLVLLCCWLRKQPREKYRTERNI